MSTKRSSQELDTATHDDEDFEAWTSKARTTGTEVDQGMELGFGDENGGDQAAVPGALRGERAHGRPVRPAARIDDPNLLFVNAGMVQFVPYFLGQRTPPYQRAVSVQKCIRTPDIDEVGKTSRHGTFFQMNGNFSFGDYFKEGAIDLAWELVTNPVGRGRLRARPGADLGDRLPRRRRGDRDLAAGRRAAQPSGSCAAGKKDNFWSMGIPGPAGPCSEIYYDRGPEYGPEGGPEVDEDRYLEFWNLVFMQYEIADVKSKEDFRIVGELPAKNIDTGMGLERMAVDPAGRRQPVRDRRGPADPRPGRRS